MNETPSLLGYAISRRAGLCNRCFGPTSLDICLRCQRDRDEFLPDHSVPLLMFFYARKGSFSGDVMHGYKSGYSDRKRSLKRTIASMQSHVECLKRAADVRSFDVTTIVPSTKGRSGPLSEVVSGFHWSAAGFRPLLEVSVDSGRSRNAGAFKSAKLSGESVLLVDDTWVTGAHAMSAAHALIAAGAKKVALLVFARWVTDSLSEYITAESLKTNAFECHLCPPITVRRQEPRAFAEIDEQSNQKPKTPGLRVYHASFGLGVITNHVGRTVIVDFGPYVGEKTVFAHTLERM